MLKGSKKSKRKRMRSKLKSPIKMSNNKNLIKRQMTPILKNVFSNEKLERLTKKESNNVSKSN